MQGYKNSFRYTAHINATHTHTLVMAAHPAVVQYFSMHSSGAYGQATF